MYIIETKTGKIIISEYVIGKIVEEAVLQFDGRVIISNHKGKLSKKTAKTGFTDDMDITFGKNGIDIRVFVVITFGTSISKVTDLLIEDVKAKILSFTGLELNSISIVVSGTMSKNIARRNIEVKG